MTRDYPPALRAACDARGLYAMRLKTGELLEIEGATEVNAEWVTVHFDVNHSRMGDLFRGLGVDVRVSDIVWVAECGRWQNQKEVVEYWKDTRP